MLNKALNIAYLIFLACLQISCMSEQLIIPDKSPQASIELNAYGMGRRDETRISLAGSIECSSFLWNKQANRKATPIVSTSFSQPKKTAKIPAGKNALLVLGQKIDDRTATIFWEMFVKPNTKYEVFTKNEFKDKFVFGSQASSLSIVVLEDGNNITINQVSAPTIGDCKNLKD